MACRKRKKNRRKMNLRKSVRGAISILLCLVLTPFMTIALGLVEYARYQSVLEITDEIYELTGISILSDYDTYMHNRFGLLATTQEKELGEGTGALLEENIQALGTQVNIENPSVNGKLPLSNTEVLRQQVIDFSELTSTTAILAEDFNLKDLLDKLQNVSQFQDVMNTIESLADLTEALKTAVEKLETLETALVSLQASISNTVSLANALAVDMAELYTNLGENGIVLPENATAEQIETAINSFCSTYLEDFKALYGTAKNLVDNLNGITTSLTSVQTAASDFISAVQQAQNAVENVTSTNSADADGSITEAATTTLEEVLDEMVGLVEDTVSDLSANAVTTAKQAVNDIIDTALESSGLAGISDRYQQIINGNYFSLPLSELAKQDLVDLLKTVQTIYSEHSGAALVSFLKDKFVPNSNINVDSILSNISRILQNATNSLVEEAGDGLMSLLTDLVNIVKGLFDLDLFYEPDLNAFVNIGSASSSPYQSFLNAVGAMFTAIEDFGDAISGIDLFGMLDALGDMFSAIGSLLTSIFDIVGASVNSIMELGSSVVSGDVQALYEKLLISGYMRHNLPCRLDSGDLSYDEDGNQTTLDLSGTGLTGFAFNDIARPAVFTGQSASFATDGGSKFQSLASTLQNLKDGHGEDTMFRGAELEYIRAGTNSEIANQIICFFDLYFLRLLLDLPSVFMDSEVGAVAAAATVASWVVYILYIIAEPFCDTLLLVNGVAVPLIKTDCWLTGTGLSGFIGKLGDAVMSEALKNELTTFTAKYTNQSNESSNEQDLGDLDYRTYMLIMLLIYVDSDTQIARLQDLVELETTEYYRQQDKAFSINTAYTAVQISASATFNPFFDLGTFTGGASLLPSLQIEQTVSY